MKKNHISFMTFLLVQVFTAGCVTTNNTTVDGLKCGQEKLEDRIVGFTYKKDSSDRFYEVNIQSSYTNKCNKPFYITKGDELKTSSSVVYVRNEMHHKYSDDLYGCESVPGLCDISPPILFSKEDWERSRQNIEYSFIRLNPNKPVIFNLETIHLHNKNEEKYFNAKTIYLLKKIDFGGLSLGEEHIAARWFDQKFYKDGGKANLIWGGTKTTLSKCTLQSEENGVRHYTCEFVKNVLKEEDKWAK